MGCSPGSAYDFQSKEPIRVHIYQEEEKSCGAKGKEETLTVGEPVLGNG